MVTVFAQAQALIKLTNAYAEIIYAEGPVLYYPLDSNTGGIIKDAIGGVDIEQVDNTWDIVTGITGSSSYGVRNDDGSSSWYAYQTVPTITGSDWAFEAWVKPEDAGFYDPIGAWFGVLAYGGNDYYTDQYSIRFEDQTIYLTLPRNDPSGQFELTAPLVGIDTWHHIVATHTNGEDIKLYVNGVLQDSASDSILGEPGNTRVVIGATDQIGSTGGTIDEVAIYSHGLTSTVVVDHYNAGLGIFPIRKFSQAAGYIQNLFGITVHAQSQARIARTYYSVSTSEVSRAFAHGTYSPTVIYVTGTNPTISGYTDYGKFTGYISISGYVQNLTVDTENSLVMMNGEVRNDLINNLDYGVYAAPGKTTFSVTGVDTISISYIDRWAL